MAYSVKWLCSDEAAKARYKRLTSGDEPYPMITHQYVVHVELNGNCENLERFQEIDADNIEHALTDRKSTRLNSSHGYISYAVFCLKKKTNDKKNKKKLTIACR